MIATESTEDTERINSVLLSVLCGKKRRKCQVGLIAHLL